MSPLRANHAHRCLHHGAPGDRPHPGTRIVPFAENGLDETRKVQLTGCRGPRGLGGCVCYLGTMGDLWLIPVRDGLAAVDAALEHVGDSVPPTAEELRSLADVAMRYVLVSKALLRYAEAVSGRPPWPVAWYVTAGPRAWRYGGTSNSGPRGPCLRPGRSVSQS